MEPFGKRLKLTENKKTRVIKDKIIFISIIEKLENLISRSVKLFNDYNLDLVTYEEGYHNVIDDLFFLKFGPIKLELIIWYLYEREIDKDGNITPLIVETDDNKLTEVIIKDASQLWDFIDQFKNR